MIRTLITIFNIIIKFIAYSTNIHLIKIFIKYLKLIPKLGKSYPILIFSNSSISIFQCNSRFCNLN